MIVDYMREGKFQEVRALSYKEWEEEGYVLEKCQSCGKIHAMVRIDENTVFSGCNIGGEIET